MDVLALLRHGGGDEADGVDDVVALDLGGGAVLALDGDALVADLGDGGLEVDGHLVEHQGLTEVGGVRQRHVRGRDQVDGVLYHSRVLALEDQLERGLAAGLAAAEDDDLVADGLLLGQELGEGHGLLKAGDGHLSGHGAGGDDDLVEAAERADVVDLGVEADLDAVAGDLLLVPLDELLVVLLEGHGRSGDEQSAQTVGLLEDDRLVAAALEHQGTFHTADAAADDGDLLRLGGRDDLVLVVLHRRRGQGAAGKVHGIPQRLQVVRALVLGHVEAAVVAADAGLYVLLAAFLDLDDPLGVDEVLAGDGDGVEPAGLDLGRGDLGLHLAGADDRDVAVVLYVLNFRKVAVVGHVLRRMRPVPGVVGAVVAVEHVVAGFLKQLDDLLGLSHVAAEFLELLAGDGALEEVLRLGDDGVTQGDGEVRSGFLLDLLDDIGGEAQAVLQRAAVLVGTVVEVRDGELVESVALVDGVDLDAVDTGLAQELGGLAEGGDALLDLLNGQRLGLVVLLPAVGRVGGGGAEVLGVHYRAGELADDRVVKAHADHVGDGHGTSAAGGQLDEQLGTGLVELLHVLLQGLVEALVVVQPAVAHDVAHPLHAGENEANAVSCLLKQEIGRFLIEVAGLHPAEQGRAAHGAHDYAVFDLHIADLPGCKQSIVLLIHAIHPFLNTF